jgi:hypothetical protein
MGRAMVSHGGFVATIGFQPVSRETASIPSFSYSTGKCREDLSGLDGSLEDLALLAESQQSKPVDKVRLNLEKFVWSSREK